MGPVFSTMAADDGGPSALEAKLGPVRSAGTYDGATHTNDFLQLSNRLGGVYTNQEVRMMSQSHLCYLLISMAEGNVRGVCVCV